MDLFNISSQEILERISRHCPEAMAAYIQCLNRMDFDGTIFFSQDLVEVDMSEDWCDFKKKIKKLALENLLEWHPCNKGIIVTVADMNEV